MTRKNMYTNASSLMAMICASASMSLVGCGSSFQAASGATAVSSLSAGGGQTPGTNTPGVGASEWDKLSMNGQVSAGRFASVQVISIDKVTKELVLSLPMPANPYLDGAMIDVPLVQLPGAHIHLDAIAGGGSALSLRVPLASILKGVAIGNPQSLPNGDPLPAVASGQLPSAAVSLSNVAGKNINATIYLAVSTLVSLSIPIKSEDKTQTWGYLTSVPAKTGQDGGFFISIHIPDAIARVIDNNL
jgi:hypothetical protein